MAEQNSRHGNSRPYGTPIRQAIASGDVERMKQIRDEAERWLAEHGDVAAALEHLRAEIAKKSSPG